LDFKLLSSRNLGLAMAIFTSGAIQCFEQPHRLAASNGLSAPARQLPRGLPCLVKRTSDLDSVAVDGRHSLRCREARIVRAQPRGCKRDLAEFG